MTDILKIFFWLRGLAKQSNFKVIIILIIIILGVFLYNFVIGFANKSGGMVAEKALRNEEKKENKVIIQQETQGERSPAIISDESTIIYEN